jgi:hypothetical protein
MSDVLCAVQQLADALLLIHVGQMWCRRHYSCDLTAVLYQLLVVVSNSANVQTLVCCVRNAALAGSVLRFLNGHCRLQCLLEALLPRACWHLHRCCGIICLTHAVLACM